jgi:hypothetical protein
MYICICIYNPLSIPGTPVAASSTLPVVCSAPAMALTNHGQNCQKAQGNCGNKIHKFDSFHSWKFDKFCWKFVGNCQDFWILPTNLETSSFYMSASQNLCMFPQIVVDPKQWKSWLCVCLHVMKILDPQTLSIIISLKPTNSHSRVCCFIHHIKEKS